MKIEDILRKMNDPYDKDENVDAIIKYFIKNGEINPADLKLCKMIGYKNRIGEEAMYAPFDSQESKKYRYRVIEDAKQKNMKIIKEIIKKFLYYLENEREKINFSFFDDIEILNSNDIKLLRELSNAPEEILLNYLDKKNNVSTFIRKVYSNMGYIYSSPDKTSIDEGALFIYEFDKTKYRNFRIYLNNPDDELGNVFISNFILKCYNNNIPYTIKCNQSEGPDNTVIYCRNEFFIKTIEILEELKIEYPSITEKFGSPMWYGSNVGSYYAITHMGLIKKNKRGVISNECSFTGSTKWLLEAAFYHTYVELTQNKKNITESLNKFQEYSKNKEGVDYDAINCIVLDDKITRLKVQEFFSSISIEKIRPLVKKYIRIISNISQHRDINSNVSSTISRSMIEAAILEKKGLLYPKNSKIFAETNNELSVNIDSSKKQIEDKENVSKITKGTSNFITSEESNKLNEVFHTCIAFDRVDYKDPKVYAQIMCLIAGSISYEEDKNYWANRWADACYTYDGKKEFFTEKDRDLFDIPGVSLFNNTDLFKNGNEETIAYFRIKQLLKLASEYIKNENKKKNIKNPNYNYWDLKEDVVINIVNEITGVRQDRTRSW